MQPPAFRPQDSLAEVEEKYKKAMVSNAQLDNEKTNFMYQVDTLKDVLLELEEQLAESRRQYEEKNKVQCGACRAGPWVRGARNVGIPVHGVHTPAHAFSIGQQACLLLTEKRSRAGSLSARKGVLVQVPLRTPGLIHP